MHCAPNRAAGGEGAPEGCLQLPLYVEDWAEDVAVRLLTLLSNLGGWVTGCLVAHSISMPAHSQQRLDIIARSVLDVAR